ncbi:MAG: hypothetical protein JWN22_1395 [Nocardioides sp.]|jgi:hypothetical protein|nr:hypothetical protein [Nocardioides sp.]
MEMDIQAETTAGELVDAWLRQLRVSGHLENTTVNEGIVLARKVCSLDLMA